MDIYTCFVCNTQPVTKRGADPFMFRCLTCENWVHGRCCIPPITGSTKKYEMLYCSKECGTNKKANIKEPKFREVCICREKVYDKRRGFIRCYSCTGWFHTDCTIEIDEYEQYSKWHCNECISAGSGPSVLKKSDKQKGYRKRKYTKRKTNVSSTAVKRAKKHNELASIEKAGNTSSTGHEEVLSNNIYSVSNIQNIDYDAESSNETILVTEEHVDVDESSAGNVPEINKDEPETGNTVAPSNMFRKEHEFGKPEEIKYHTKEVHGCSIM